MVDDISTQTHREDVNTTTTQTNMMSFWCEGVLRKQERELRKHQQERRKTRKRKQKARGVKRLTVITCN
jgi:hypothetical protein